MKKNLTFSKLLMLFVIAVLPLGMMAQKVGNQNKRPAEKYWYIQADGGLSINHGDLANYEGWMFTNSDNYLQTMAFKNWNAHLGIGYQFGKVIGLNLKGGYGLLSGHKHMGQQLVFNSDANQTVYKDLGLDKSNYIEGNLNLTFNLFNIFNYNPRRVINLVPHIGIGGLYYKGGTVNQLDENDNVDNTLANPADKRELTFTVPAGMEVTFNVAPKFDIFVDYTYNFTGSDNLDQVAKIAGDEAKHIINDKDMYSQLNLGLRYKFNNPCDIEKMPDQIEVYAVPDPLQADEDGNVCFDVVVKVPANYFQKEAVLNLRPKFTYKGGEIEVPEPIIMVGEKVKAESGYDFRVPYAEGGEFTKHYNKESNLCMPYQEEMSNCELMGDPMVYVYDGHIYPTQDEIVKNAYFVQGKTQKLADGVSVPDCPKVTNIRKEVNGKNITWTWDADPIVSAFEVIVKVDNRQVKKEKITAKTYSINMTEEGEYKIEIGSDCKYSTGDKVEGEGANNVIEEIKPDIVYFFDYNKSNIPGNNKEVKKRNEIARQSVKELLKDGNKSIRIEGYASPENGMGTNDQLSKDRAEAAVRDIKAQVKKNAKNIEVKSQKGNGSDWDTFKKLVEKSNIKDKDAILNKVKNASNKEKEIQDLKHVYPELERDVLPLIRRAEIFIEK